jgi:hypothetical protein
MDKRDVYYHLAMENMTEKAKRALVAAILIGCQLDGKKRELRFKPNYYEDQLTMDYFTTLINLNASVNEDATEAAVINFHVKS